MDSNTKTIESLLQKREELIRKVEHIDKVLKYCKDHEFVNLNKTRDKVLYILKAENKEMTAKDISPFLFKDGKRIWHDSVRICLSDMIKEGVVIQVEGVNKIPKYYKYIHR